MEEMKPDLAMVAGALPVPWLVSSASSWAWSPERRVFSEDTNIQSGKFATLFLFELQQTHFVDTAVDRWLLNWLLLLRWKSAICQFYSHVY